MRGAIDFLVGIAGQTIVFALVGGAALGVLIGLLLLVDSPRVLRWNECLSRWISTREATAPLDASHDIKRYVYRTHRVVGLLVVAGALFALDVLTFGFQSGAVVRAFRGLGNQGMLGVAVDAARAFLILGNLAALAAGVVLCFRPSLLKGIEGWADRTYATRAASPALDRMHFEPDRWVARHPRTAGVLVLAGSAFILFSLGVAPRL